MIQSCYFWIGCERTFTNKLSTVSDIIGDVFVKDFADVQSTLSAIYFPFCHGNHWYVGVINLKDQRIQIADSLSRSPPPKFVQTLLYVLRVIGVDTSDWNPKCGRLRCPRQQDGQSCGVAALSFIQATCAEAHSAADRWSPENSDIYRIRWLERMISYHDPEKYPCDTAKVSSFVRTMEKVSLFLNSG